MSHKLNEPLFKPDGGNPGPLLIGDGFTLELIDQRAGALDLELDEHLISVVIGGPLHKKFRLASDGRVAARLAAQSIQFLPAGVPMQISWEPAEFTLIRVAPYRLQRAIDGLQDAAWRPLRPAKGMTDAITGKLASDLCRRLKWDETVEPMYAESVITIISVRLAEKLGLIESRSGNTDTGVLGPILERRLRDHIENCLDESLQLADLAGIAGLGVYRFSRAFTATFGVSPYRYVIERRIERAKHLLLRDGDQTVADIAYATGFSSHAHLCVAFKAATGLTPTEYRRHRRAPAVGTSARI